MSEGYITYKGVPTCNVDKTLELQKWILDPRLRNSQSQGQARTQELRTHSAVKTIEKRLTAEQCIELQRLIIDKET